LYKDARRGLFRNALESMLEAMEETRQRVSYPALKGEASCFIAPPCP